jgi:hypothetical protein
VRKRLKDNGLSLSLFALFTACVVVQIIAGRARYDDERREHGRASVSYGEYLTSGDLIESIFENWESEFLQMAAFLMLSASLVQRGSAASKDPDGDDEHDADPIAARTPDSPRPVQRGGAALALYERSLTLALFALFLVSWGLHALGGRMKASEEAVSHGDPPLALLDYLASSQFWFESMQNWQSEFLSVGVLVVLSIFLRQHGSPQSKPVHAPHSQTGS